MCQVKPFVILRLWQRREAVNAGCMIEKLSYREVMAVCWRLLNVFGDVVVESQFAFIGKLQDHCRQNVLGDRSDVKDRVWRDCDRVLEVGQAVALGKDNLAVAGHSN